MFKSGSDVGLVYSSGIDERPRFRVERSAELRVKDLFQAGQ